MAARRQAEFIKRATAAAAGSIADATVVLTRRAVVDFHTVGAAAVALALLWSLEVEEPYIVRLGTVAGLLLN